MAVCGVGVQPPKRKAALNRPAATNEPTLRIGRDADLLWFMLFSLALKDAIHNQFDTSLTIPNGSSDEVASAIALTAPVNAPRAQVAGTLPRKSTCLTPGIGGLSTEASLVESRDKL